MNQSNKKTNNSIYDYADNNKTIEKTEKTSTPRIDSIFEKYSDMVSTKMQMQKSKNKNMTVKYDLAKNINGR
jgi:hypothetical protein